MQESLGVARNFSNQSSQSPDTSSQQEQIPRGLKRLCRNQCRRSAAQSNFRVYLSRIAEREQHSVGGQGALAR